MEYASASKLIIAGLRCAGTTAILLIAAPGASAAVPAVFVTAALDQASEQGPTPGVFQFTRTGDLSSPLVVDFTLAGTATEGVDYLIWERTAHFEAGSPTAWVAILPRNDAQQEGPETVILTLAPGAGYTIGAPDRATVTIHDAWAGSDFPGVWDLVEPWLQKDLRYLESRIEAGHLIVRIGVNNATLTPIEIWLDTDQNPATGDIRQGYMAGIDYRAQVNLTFFQADYSLYRMPRAQSDCDALGRCQEISLVTLGPVGTDAQGMVILAIPLGLIGNPTAVDVFATSYTGGVGTFGLVANGDRVPKFGAIDTASGKVVVRRPGVTYFTEIADPAGDADPRGFDLLGARFLTLADQFTMQIALGQPVGAGSIGTFGPTVAILLDSDRNLVTGAWPLLDKDEGIPSWGAELKLRFDAAVQGTGISGTPLLQFDPGASGQAEFGGIANDGRWRAEGTTLTFHGSLSIFDAFRKTAQPSIERIPTTGDMMAVVETYFNQGQGVADRLPDRHHVVRSRTGALVRLFAWDPDRTIIVDDEPSGPLGGGTDFDLTRVQAQVSDGHLIVRGVLSSWPIFVPGHLHEVLLDTDMNLATGEPWANPFSGVALGADYRFEVSSKDGVSVFYLGHLVLPDGTKVIADSMFFPEPSFGFDQPGRFTVTFPLTLLGNPDQLRLYLASGQDGGAGRLDTAPLTPLHIGISETTPSDPPAPPPSPGPAPPIGPPLPLPGPMTVMRYLAEGATGPFFDLDVALLNPHEEPAAVEVWFLREHDTPVVNSFTMPARSRRTLRVNDVEGLASTAVSTVVVSLAGLPLVVERTMFWNRELYYGGHSGNGVDSPRATWYFAEGSQGFFDTFVLLANSQDVPASVAIRFLTETEGTVTKHFTVDPHTRQTVWTGWYPELVNRSFSFVVTSDVPIIAERAMYFSAGRFWEGGHGSAGVPEPATSWFHAEGATGPFFDLWLLLGNPNDHTANVTVTYLLANQAIAKTFTVEGNSRRTIFVAGEDPQLEQAAVSMVVNSDLPIVSERAMYWPRGAWYEAHNSFGMTETGTRWGLAEGRAGGPRGYQTFALVSNPSTTEAAEIEVTFLVEDGSPLVRTFTVPPETRFNIDANAHVAASTATTVRFGTLVESTNGVPIAVETAMYWGSVGPQGEPRPWAGGTNVTATKLP